MSNETRTVVVDGSSIGTNAVDTIVIDGQGRTLLPGRSDSHNRRTAVEDLQNRVAYGATTEMWASDWGVPDLCKSFRRQLGLPGELLIPD